MDLLHGHCGIASSLPELGKENHCLIYWVAHFGTEGRTISLGAGGVSGVNAFSPAPAICKPVPIRLGLRTAL